jgi:hypothetical protein
MQNTARLAKKKQRKFSFDLKGSSINRKAPPSSSLLKDLNFQELEQQNKKGHSRFLVRISPSDYLDLT